MDCGGRAVAATPPWVERSDGGKRTVYPFEGGVALRLPPHSRFAPTGLDAALDLIAGRA